MRGDPLRGLPPSERRGNFPVQPRGGWAEPAGIWTGERLARWLWECSGLPCARWDETIRGPRDKDAAECDLLLYPIVEQKTGWLEFEKLMRVFVSFENITIQCRNRITMISYSQYYRKLSLVAMEFVILNFLTRLSEVSGPRYRTTITDLMPPSRVGVGNRTEIDLIFKDV